MNWHGWVGLALGVLALMLIGAAVWAHLRSRPGSRRPHLGRLVLSVVVGLLVGAGGRFLRGPFPPPEPKPAGDGGLLVTTIPVGPDGARADLPGGGHIHVPSGAVGTPTTINVWKRPVGHQVTIQSPTDGAPLTFAPGTLFVYDLTPHDTALSKPIELALPVPPGQKIAVFVTANGEARALPGVAAGQTARVSITSFNLDTPGAVTVAR